MTISIICDFRRSDQKIPGRTVGRAAGKMAGGTAERTAGRKAGGTDMRKGRNMNYEHLNLLVPSLCILACWC